jgi:hypothetical protein
MKKKIYLQPSIEWFHMQAEMPIASSNFEKSEMEIPEIITDPGILIDPSGAMGNVRPDIIDDDFYVLP